MFGSRANTINRISESAFELDEKQGVLLPKSHFSLLERLNGATCYHGFFRIYGSNSVEILDVFRRNVRTCWKYAWREKVDDFFCFGETGWGDQYAYRYDELRSNRACTPVYFLDALRMEPERIAESFDDFFENEFLRNSTTPYDSLVSRVIERFGALAVDQHASYSPSLLLSGDESVDNVLLLPAQTALIFNGDLYTQLIVEPKSTMQPDELTTYEDERGQARLKVNWRVN